MPGSRTRAVRTRGEFATVGAKGRRGSAGVLRLRFLSGEATSGIRLATAVSKKGANAVKRNRARRRIRAAAELLADALEPGIYLVQADARAASVPFVELKEQLEACATQVGAMGGGR